MSSRRDYIDDRSLAYSHTGDLLASIAETRGVQLDDTTRLRWREVMVLLREVDTMADTKPDGHHAALDALKSYETFRTIAPSLSPEHLGSTTHQQMLRRAETIFILSDRHRSAATVDDYIDARVDEAVESTNLLRDSASEHVYSQESFERQFMPTARNLGICANLLDSIVDLSKDHARGEVQFTPTASVYRQLAARAIHHSTSDALVLFRPDTMKIRLHAIYDRACNRIATGITPDSTLGSIMRKFD